LNRTYSLLLLIALGLTGCNPTVFFAGKNEGIIIYDVVFPFEQNSLMMELYPKEMTLEFKKEKMRATLKSAYGVVSSEFIIDHSTGQYVQLLKSFSDKSYTLIKRQNMPAWLAQFPEVTLELTGEEDSIAGYPCQKILAHFLIDSLPPIKLCATDKLNLDQTNWWNQFSEVDGFLLGYEFEQYGKRMRLTAREVRFGPVADERFEIPGDYQELAPDQMQRRIHELLSDFVN